MYFGLLEFLLMRYPVMRFSSLFASARLLLQSHDLDPRTVWLQVLCSKNCLCTESVEGNTSDVESGSLISSALTYQWFVVQAWANKGAD